ncbi:MAG: GIDE domain-containing protein [Bdellovibrionota bacterium]
MFGNYYLIFLAAISLPISIWYLFVLIKKIRIIEDTPTSKIKSAAQGYVELKGSVSETSDGFKLISPLTENPCVWYQYKIEQSQGSYLSPNWQTIEKGTSAQKFIISDDSGSCIIDPRDAEIITDHSRLWHGSTLYPMTKTANSQFKPNNSFLINASLRSHQQTRYRYSEKFIYAHDVIHVFGYFHTEGGGRNIPSISKITSQVLKEWRENPDKLKEKFDENKDGKIDMWEWDKVRKAAINNAEQKRKKLFNTPIIHILSKDKLNKHPFIISTHSQKELLSKLRFYSFISVTVILCSCLYLWKYLIY